MCKWYCKLFLPLYFIDCSPDPCIYGQCVNGTDSYFCRCISGFTGKLCDKGSNICVLYCICLFFLYFYRICRLHYLCKFVKPKAMKFVLVASQMSILHQ